MHGESEVAQLLQQINLEYAAAKSVIDGQFVMMGGHDFIETRMQRMADATEQLAERVGKQEAVRLVIERMEEIQEEGER